MRRCFRLLPALVLFFLISLALPALAQDQPPENQPAPQPAQSKDVVIKNATLMTVTHGKVEHGSVLIHAGKIAAFGASVNAPADATVIDASGKFVTPGLVDPHSHITLHDSRHEAPNPG